MGVDSRWPKMALVTADTRDGFITTPMGDHWNMYYWANVLQAYHLSYETLRANPSRLDEFDWAICSGHPQYLETLLEVAEQSKCRIAFFPEGDVSLYHDRVRCAGAEQFIYRIWNSVDFVAVVEEDKIPFYELFTHVPVKFIHVPVPKRLVRGDYFVGVQGKSRDLLIYGDNNPNNPHIAFGVARRLRLPVSVTAVPITDVEFYGRYFGVSIARASEKTDQDDYLRHWMGPSRVCIYPTNWIGTSRQVIAGAACGTPVVGNRDSHVMKRLFPELGVYNYDVRRIIELVTKLYADDEYYRSIVERSRSALEFYSEKNALGRLLLAMEYTELRQQSQTAS